MVSYLEEGREEGGRLLLKNWCLTTGSASVKLVGIIEIGDVAHATYCAVPDKTIPEV